jgi:hypothetical protein
MFLPQDRWEQEPVSARPAPRYKDLLPARRQIRAQNAPKTDKRQINKLDFGSSLYSNTTDSRLQKVLNWIVAGITVPNFLMNENLICYCLSQIINVNRMADDWREIQASILEEEVWQLGEVVEGFDPWDFSPWSQYSCITCSSVVLLTYYSLLDYCNS